MQIEHVFTVMLHPNVDFNADKTFGIEIIEPETVEGIQLGKIPKATITITND